MRSPCIEPVTDKVKADKKCPSAKQDKVELSSDQSHRSAQATGTSSQRADSEVSI